MESYLDNSATTKAFEDVAQLVAKTMIENFGNPSSMHHKGKDAEDLVKDAKKKIAKTLRCEEKEIILTSGGTESDNMALIGTALSRQKEVGKHLITTKIEHPAILETMKHLEKEGFEVTYLSVDNQGRIDLNELEKAIRPDTALVSIMFVNNEIGALEPIAEAGELIKKVNPKTYFHVDAVQGYGKFSIIPKNMGIDMLSVSGHKIHGPKGIGFLYVKNSVRIVPINYGGGQQKGMRSGTENVPGIVGLGRAAEEIYANLDEHVAKLRELKAYFINEVTSKLPDITINGRIDEISAPHIISLSVKGVRAEVLLHALEDREVYVSAGSACASNHPHVSDTLKAIGLDSDLLDSTIRVSLSVFTTKEEIDHAIEAMCAVIPLLRRYSRQ
ncbi:cysteine desulfurase family protein [Butyrivibrio sp. NC3005]|uniref:cysteine desulfurase family protein n=1 Tax=Butyrivibrio sp. NC3005 TaxID=1280685 RepID=UPI0003F8CB72|nr:cysteine desulfurase family protein [Butyrivibrio sp. NC3005]